MWAHELRITPEQIHKSLASKQNSSLLFKYEWDIPTFYLILTIQLDVALIFCSFTVTSGEMDRRS